MGQKSGFHPYRACSEITAGRCFSIYTHTVSIKDWYWERAHLLDYWGLGESYFLWWIPFLFVASAKKIIQTRKDELYHQSCIVPAVRHLETIAGLASQPRELTHSQFCLRTLPWIKKTLFQSRTVWSQTNCFSSNMKPHAIRLKKINR